MDETTANSLLISDLFADYRWICSFQLKLILLGNFHPLSWLCLTAKENDLTIFTRKRRRQWNTCILRALKVEICVSLLFNWRTTMEMCDFVANSNNYRRSAQEVVTYFLSTGFSGNWVNWAASHSLISSLISLFDNKFNLPLPPAKVA